MKKPLVRLVVAYSLNRVIGRDGTMPWHLPSDLAHFKRSTLGQAIVMGRKTWESLGRALPGRANLVISRNASLIAPGARVFPSLEAALEDCRTRQAPAVSVIGGEQIYRLALPLADEVLATEIKAEIEGDTYFPELDGGQWLEAAREAAPRENGLDFDFVTYRRRDAA